MPQICPKKSPIVSDKIKREMSSSNFAVRTQPGTWLAIITAKFKSTIKSTDKEPTWSCEWPIRHVTWPHGLSGIFQLECVTWCRSRCIWPLTKVVIPAIDLGWLWTCYELVSGIIRKLLISAFEWYLQIYNTTSPGWDSHMNSHPQMTCIFRIIKGSLVRIEYW